MKPKLYICGDSFASLDIDQEFGFSWGEIVAAKQSMSLENLARPAASNVTIAMQINYALANLTPDDYVIVVLTDHYRLTVATAPVKQSDQLLTQTMPHIQQRYHSAYQGNSILSVNITNPLWHKYFEHGYDPVIQHFVESHVMRSMIALLKEKTSNYLIVSGGWGRKLAVDLDLVKVLQVPESAVLSLTQENMSALNISDARYINHLDNMGHAKLANTILMKLRSINE